MYRYTRAFIKGFYKVYSTNFAHPKRMIVLSLFINASIVYTIVRIVKLIAHLV